MARNLINLTVDSVDFVAWTFNGGYQLKVVGADAPFARVERQRAGGWWFLAIDGEDFSSYRTLTEALTRAAEVFVQRLADQARQERRQWLSTPYFIQAG